MLSSLIRVKMAFVNGILGDSGLARLSQLCKKATANPLLFLDAFNTLNPCLLHFLLQYLFVNLFQRVFGRYTY